MIKIHNGLDMDREYLNLFSVLIQITELELNIDSLIEFCYEMKRKDEKGVEISNIGGWQSNDVINETHTEFVKLKTEIEGAAKIYHEEMKFKKTLKQRISKIWININQKGHSNEFHDHPRSIFSGAFYLTKRNAPIMFQHPFRDINTYFWDESIVEEWNFYNAGVSNILPKPNILLIFPPWAEHKVKPNEEDTDRISLSFNTQLQIIEKGNG